MTKEEVIDFFNIKKNEVRVLEAFLLDLKKTNKQINLVGPSTLLNPWDRHICDSIQLTTIIKNKQSSIIDMGTGAGFPGLVMAMVGYNNITLVDSKKKKVNFLNKAIRKLNLKTKVINARVEDIKPRPFEFVISRALAPLERLLNYSLFFSNKNTTLVFLKGRSVMNEISEAKKGFYFNFKTVNSLSSGCGKIVKIKNLVKYD